MENRAFNSNETIENKNQLDKNGSSTEIYFECETSQTRTSSLSTNTIQSDLLYNLTESPPWHVCILLSLQNFLFSVGSLVGMPLIIASSLCLGDNEVGNLGRANLINSVFFVSGICTILQVTLGNRLPIFQGTSFAFLPPVLAILNLPHNQCPSQLPDGFMNSTVPLYNDTDGQIVDGEELWHRRIREVQGSIFLSGLVEFLFGFTGVVGFLMRYIGPLTIAPTISLIGLDLFTTIANDCEGHWGIALGTTAVVILFSQYLTDVGIPLPSYSTNKKLHFKKFYLFKLFPVLMALLLAWLLCFILTITNVFPDDPNHLNYQARTDIRADVIASSPWFRIPYPGQWGLPTISVAGFVAMIATIVSSIISSVGDYHACAKLANVPKPPNHAINRAITLEGFGVFLAGLVGTGTGTTSFCENIAIIGITKVASRVVLQVAGVIFICLAVIGKFGSIFVTIPDPVIGGILLVMFGMVASVGLSNLQYVDLNSKRNIFIIGFSILAPLTIANWIKTNPGNIQTGVPILDQIFTVLLSSSLFLGGLLGFFLDNTLPGTLKERGLEAWRLSSLVGFAEDGTSVGNDCYNLPFETSCCKFSFYIPILPNFGKKKNAVGVVEDENVVSQF